MIEIKKWAGLQNTTAPERLKPGELSVAQNVDIDDSARVLTRRGQTLLQGGSYHSLWSGDSTALVVSGQDLKRIEASGSLTQLRRLTSGRHVSYAELNGVVYLSNGVDSLRVTRGEALQWGVTPPAGQPKAAATVGTLPAGRYMYAMTFLRADGQESGTGVAGMVELTAPGGIAFSGMETSTNPEVTGKILYLSHADGEELYRAVTLPATATTHTYTNGGYDLGVPLQTQFRQAAPAGDIVAVHASIAYVVEGSVAWYSDAFSLEHFSRTRYLQLPGRIALFAPVDDGIYAATETGTWFLRGHEPSEMKATQVLSYGAIPGTAVRDDATVTAEDGAEASRPVVFWTSPYGVVLGHSGGVVRNLTEDRYSFPAAQRGAGVVRLERGYVQYISTLQGTGSAPNAYQ